MKNEYDVDFENISGGSNGSLRWISLLVMAMVVFGFFWLMLYAYDNDAKPADGDMIASISPENGDYKIKPDEAGGMAIENKDIEAYQLMRNAPNVANEVEQVERLLPLAERPIIRDIPAGETAIIGDAPAAIANKIPQAVVADEVVNEATDNVDVAINEVLSKQAAQVAAPSATTQMTMSEVAAPVEKVVEPQVIAAPIAKMIEPKIIAVAPAPKVEAKIEPKIIVAPKPVAIAPVAPKPVVQILALPKPAVAPATVYSAPKIAPAVVASNGSAYIQFAALRTASDAPRVWGELKAKHPELAAYSYYTESVTTATGATLHRLRARGFADRNQALSICSAMKARGQDCLVSSN